MRRPSIPSPRSPRLRALALLLPLAAATALAGCATQGQAIGTHGGASVTSSAGLSPAQINQAARAWGQRYDKNPDDRTTILNYAAALRLDGRVDQAVAVLEKGMIKFKTTAPCRPPTARRWRPTAASSRR
ncbi:hypothetical protein [Methylobrevis pamukkalensis]|uniref:Tetratricopeptide repeat protein n=1 Tax=Methylobrevis pamukkalensis TaxID=1439726 RepID=A0A1E3GNH8_9HYPH|nr:hypothetical protein A6302_04514 [Methylobrevis pamukkalensis]